jgi:hypothetical protein
LVAYYCNVTKSLCSMPYWSSLAYLLLEQIHGKSTASGAQCVLCRLCFSKSKNVLALEVGIRLFEALDGLHFSGTQGLTRIVVLLVGLVSSFGVTKLRLKVVVVLDFKVLDTLPVTPLRITLSIEEKEQKDYVRNTGATMRVKDISSRTPHKRTTKGSQARKVLTCQCSS